MHCEAGAPCLQSDALSTVDQTMPPWIVLLNCRACEHTWKCRQYKGNALLGDWLFLIPLPRHSHAVATWRYQQFKSFIEVVVRSRGASKHRRHVQHDSGPVQETRYLLDTSRQHYLLYRAREAPVGRVQRFALSGAVSTQRP